MMAHKDDHRGNRGEKSPAFQFYPKDWLADARVRAMGREARGVYIDLLALYWNEGGLPSDTKQLADIAVVPQRTFERLWPMIAPCFGIAGTALTSKRLDREKVKQAEYKLSQSLKGQKSAKSRSSNKGVQPRLESGSPSVEPRLQPKSNSPFPSPSTTTERVVPAAASLAVTTGPDPTPNSAAAAPESSLATVVTDPFEEKPEDREKAIRELGDICTEIARRDSREVRDVLQEASRTPRGATMTNPASASLDWICQTIGRLKTTVDPAKPYVSDRMQSTRAAIDRVLGTNIGEAK